ncbi:hypothetical protein D3P09_15000 [Paenibacillus pinisoli]|uniref:Copper amine oxidase-like N-terminal domain-containing protein n=1 Tax=Paenibacillus pinisoli TaxID=1276110 RepID=A0A3A6PDZ9_9BACL|nr:hypothetical protein [Paenibacillus pinisoli]RJX38835.1 hypothetical protein D3P09_15000 [Paenibacillus pinisoli]
MKLPIRNIFLMLFAAATLYGALASPPAPEQAAVAAPVLSAHSESAIKLASAQNPSYAPLHELVNQYGGLLTYNRETDTIDLTVSGANFTLLLENGTVLQNGYEAPGDYYLQDGVLYMNADQFKKLAAFSDLAS